ITGNNFVYTTGNPGTYQFQITDGFGCVVETNVVTISEADTIAAFPDVTDPRCGDPNTGMVELVPDFSTGIPPYQFSVDGSTFTDQAVYGNLSPGTYTYYVRDSRGCFIDVPFTIGPPAPGVDANVVPNDATCASGVVSGSIDVTGNIHGIAPYVYTLFDVNGILISTITSPSETHTFTDLPTGLYSVVTRDAAGCEDRDTVTLTHTGVIIAPVPPPLPAN